MEFERAAELLNAHTTLCNLTSSVIKSMAPRWAVDLGIPDAVAAGPIGLSDLAAAVSVPPSKTRCLRRLMRLMVHSGIIAIAAGGGEEEAYLPTALSALLAKRADFGLTRFLKYQTDFYAVPILTRLTEWLRDAGASPRSTFEMVFGFTPFELASGDPAINELFNDAMTEDSRPLVRVMVDRFPDVFDGVRTLVDVGGGSGLTARAIAAAFPAVKCTVLDLPHVVAAATSAGGGGGAVRFVVGDMFEYVPPADAVLLKWILHDWKDEKCVEILRRCKEAVGAGGKIIIVDMVLGSGGDIDGAGDSKSAETQILWDIGLMLFNDGSEREESEWKSIFAAAGLHRYKFRPAALGLRSIIEVYPSKL